MNDRLNQVLWELNLIRSLIPPGVEMVEYLRQLLDEQIAALATNTPMGVVPTVSHPAEQIFASARFRVEHIDSPEQLATPEGIVDLGAIEWLLRPAFQLMAGQIVPVSTGPWHHLTPVIIEREQLSVCRIDLSVAGYNPMHLGTGWIIGSLPDGRTAFMTNAHVVEAALIRGWMTLPGLDLVCDFERFSSSAGGQLFILEHTYELHPYHDLALLYLNPLQSEFVRQHRSPLVISTAPPKTIEETEIGIIGHPSFNSDIDPFPRIFGFADQFGVKRLSVGLIRSLESRLWRNHMVDVFLHDATTLSGNSGSCILDLQTKQVLGLHFGGWPQQSMTFLPTGEGDMLAQLFFANGAVPLWLLVDDPFLKNAVIA